MARATTKAGSKTNRSATSAKRPGRPPGKSTRPAARSEAKQATPRSAKISKDDLRAQVEKLERANANLRVKNRELKRAAGEAAGRAEELERQVSRHDRRAARDAAQVAATDAPRRRAGPGRGRRPRDPGDAVPPGVAVEEPEPLGDDDRKVLDHLNEELSPR